MLPVCDTPAEASERLTDPSLKYNLLLLLLLLGELGPLACSHPDLFCKQLPGLLGRGISPSKGRYLHKTTPNRHPCHEWNSNPPCQFFRARTCRALNRAAAVIGASIIIIFQFHKYCRYFVSPEMRRALSPLPSCLHHVVSKQ
jgi:hypothetical protein